MLTFVFKTLSKIPLKNLYHLSHGITWILYHILRYRRKVVRENLVSSFPEKSEKEIKRITSEYYRFLGEYFVETIYEASMPPEEIMRRLPFKNVEAINECLRKGQHVTLYMGHYCNWEWCSSIPLHFTEKAQSFHIYHPLKNKDADDAFLMLRERYGSKSVSMQRTFRTIMGAHYDGIPTVTAYISDQAPLYENTHLFVDFLNHDTPVFTGGEKISRKLGAAVFYCDMRRKSKGHYECTYVEISPDATKEEPFEITKKYWQLLEESIRRDPAYWLWSHRRWKRTRSGMIERYGEADTAKRLSTL